MLPTQIAKLSAELERKSWSVEKDTVHTSTHVPTPLVVNISHYW